MIERLVVKAPAERGFTVSDLTIGGEPLCYGGQIAERISVKLTGVAGAFGLVRNTPTLQGSLLYDPAYPAVLNQSVPYPQSVPPGTIPAFAREGEEEILEGTPRRRIANTGKIAASPNRRM